MTRNIFATVPYFISYLKRAGNPFQLKGRQFPADHD